MEILIDGFNDFSLDFLQSVQYYQPANQNIVFSSYSLVLGLLMALAGSKKDTRLEMIRTLKINNYLGSDIKKYENLDVFFKNLHLNLFKHYSSLPSHNMNNTILIANKILVNNRNINKSYRDLIEKRFNTKIDIINGSFKKAIEKTNKDIARLTNDKIKKLLDKSFEAASLVLINVIYFNYNWLYKFNERLTEKNAKFYLNPQRSKSSKFDMMNLYRTRLPFSYLKSIDSHLISLPYENKKFHFNIIFSNEKNDFLSKDDETSILNRIDFYELNSALFDGNRQQRTIDLRMPKFTIKTKLELAPLLQDLGIVRAFDQDNADFSGISSKNDLYIDQVIQQAFIEVNEKGTEAAAATAIKIKTRSFNVPFKVNLERPFIFMITDNEKELILFTGIFKGQPNQ